MAKKTSGTVEHITPDNMDVVPHEMWSAMQEYMDNHGYKDITTDVTQYRWKSVLYYIHDKCFPVKSVFKKGDDTYSDFDIDVLTFIYEAYARLCAECGKITFLADFSILTGIEATQFAEWGANTRKRLTPAARELWQKINADNEASLSTQMISTRQNPVGFMAILNHYHSWNMPGVKTSQIEQRRTPEQIAAAHGVESIGDNAQKILPSADFLRDENGAENT